MKRLVLALTPLAAFALPAPAVAQDGPGEDVAGMMNMLGGMFPSEPLTAEEEARLPAATALVEKIVPPGTMGEMMGGMFDSMLGPLMQMGAADPVAALAETLGAESWQFDLDEEEAKAALAIIDPDWQERRRLEAEVFPQMINAMMVAMEPSVKSAMAQMYAVYFDDQELADIDAFFSTASGAAYARKSFAMSSDPRMMGAMMQVMPIVMESLGDIENQMMLATINLPNPRSFGELSAEQRKQLQVLLGLNEDELANALPSDAEPAIE